MSAPQEGDQGLSALMTAQSDVVKRIEVDQSATKDARKYALWLSKTLRVSQVLRGVLSVWKKGEITFPIQGGDIYTDGSGLVKVSHGIIFPFKDVWKSGPITINHRNERGLIVTQEVGTGPDEWRILTRKRRFDVAVTLCPEDPSRNKVVVSDLNPVRHGVDEVRREIPLSGDLDVLAQRLDREAYKLIKSYEEGDLPDELIEQSTQRLKDIPRSAYLLGRVKTEK